MNTGNGVIDFKEFMDTMSRKPRNSKIEEELRESFKFFDKDRNGYITANELRLAMLTLGEKLSDCELEEMMKEFDKDKDGRINCDGKIKISII